MRCLILSAALPLLFFSAVCAAYDRSDYRHWVDLDGDGKDTREEILICDIVTAVAFSPTDRVASGLWVCPYTGKITGDPRDLDIDHLVALGEIDAAGGHAWGTEEKMQFANDPDNLIAVYKGANRSKGDKDAVTGQF